MEGEDRLGVSYWLVPRTSFRTSPQRGRGSPAAQTPILPSIFCKRLLRVMGTSVLLKRFPLVRGHGCKRKLLAWGL